MNFTKCAVKPLALAMGNTSTLVFNAGIWVFEKALNKMIEKTIIEE